MRTGSTVAIGIPDSWRGHRAEQVVLEVIADMNLAAEGRVPFRLASGSSGDLTVTVNPTGATPDGTPAAAYFRASYEGWWVKGGDVVLTSPYYATLLDWPPSWWGMLRRNLSHEVGHALGLQHTTIGDGLMTVGDIRSISYWEYVGRNLSSAELVLLHLAYQRTPGNAYPDDGRGVLPTMGRRSEIICALPPVR